MAERWQQWMRLDIDSWQGSANIQALSDAAYRAVDNLIMAMYQSDDCTLPLDDRKLAKMSRMFGRWADCRDEVLEYFTLIEGDRLTHKVVQSKWTQAKEDYEKKCKGAQRTNSARSAHAQRAESDTVSERTPVSKTREDKTTEEKKQKQPQAAFVLPEWVDRGAWQAYEEMRGKIRKPMTDHAKGLAVIELVKLRSRGHDPTAVLNQSTMNSWQGLFEPKGQSNGTNQQSTVKISPAVQRGIDTRSRIADAVARRIGRAIGGVDGRDASQFPETGVAARNGYDVAGTVGRDSGEIRHEDFQGRTVEGNAGRVDT